ncbi:hypothetical protein [Nonomuraea sp. NPDC049695]|uniref:hypothetical protein n=1 Tax=Nonomuraea sp. NPDC049695 TaxID=3154734 RepID=UPI00341B9A51
MGSETFYATAAQVLPTLMIALVIEFGAIFRIAKEATKHFGEEVGGGSEPQWTDADLVTGLKIALGAAAVFLIGEVLALLALGFRWFNVWTFSLVGICLLVLIITVVWIPLIRLLEETLR